MTAPNGTSAAGAIDLLLRLRTAGVRVWVRDGALCHDAGTPDSPGLHDDLRAQLEERGDEVLAYLLAADDHEHETCYVPVADGVELAADIFRPRCAGELVTGPLPVVWCHDRYQRSSFQDGLEWTKLDSRPWLRTLLRHGYVVAVVDARGTGASTGVRHTEFGAQERSDSFAVTEWLAARPWSSGAVGMFGDSYLAIAALLAAGTAPPHLKAIFPQMPLFDLYSFLYPGGVFRHDFVRRWGARTAELDTRPGVVPVRGRDGTAEAALAEHAANYDVPAHAASFPFRDSVDEHGHCLYDLSPSECVAAINASGVAVHLLSGWYDMWVRDAVLWFANLETPCRLTIGPSAHTGREEIDLATEHLRWFDHWLKGVDNGVMDEPPVRYRTLGGSWQEAETWPPAGVVSRTFRFSGAVSGSAGSVNDGSLVSGEPGPHDAGDAEPYDEYVVDYTTTSGATTRWVNGSGGDFGYGSMAGNDRRALTYTTAPLSEEIEVTGHPVARLWVSSTYPDGDFFVYLEDVEPDGNSRYVTEGVLRASRRALGTAPYRDLGLPYPAGTESSVDDLGPAPVELVVDLHPTSYLFGAGHRLRVPVTCCDRDNALTPVHEPAPVVTLHRGTATPSGITLPTMPRTPGEPPCH